MKTILPQPITNVQEVLYTLISQGNVSFIDFSYLQGFRTRVSNLKALYGLKLNIENKEGKNKFGRTYKYHLHVLPLEEKQNAIDLYFELYSNSSKKNQKQLANIDALKNCEEAISKIL